MSRKSEGGKDVVTDNSSEVKHESKNLIASQCVQPRLHRTAFKWSAVYLGHDSVILIPTVS